MMSSLSQHGPQTVSFGPILPPSSSSVAASASSSSPDLSGRGSRPRRNPPQPPSRAPLTSPSPLCHSASSSPCGLTLSLEKLLESAQLTGDLRLTGRNLKALPSAWTTTTGEGGTQQQQQQGEKKAKYDLRDTVKAGNVSPPHPFHFVT